MSSLVARNGSAAYTSTRQPRQGACLITSQCGQTVVATGTYVIPQRRNGNSGSMISNSRSPVNNSQSPASNSQSPASNFRPSVNGSYHSSVNQNGILTKLNSSGQGSTWIRSNDRTTEEKNPNSDQKKKPGRPDVPPEHMFLHQIKPGKRWHRVGIIPFMINDDGTITFSLVVGKSGITSSIGGGPTENDHNMIDTLGREIFEEIKEVFSIDYSTLANCPVAVSGSSLTIFYRISEIKEEFIPNDEIHQLLFLNKKQFLAFIYGFNNHYEDFKVSKFIKNIVTEEQLDAIVTYKITDELSNFKIADYVVEDFDCSIENFIDQLKNEVKNFHGRIIIVSDENNCYFVDSSRHVYSCENKEEVLEEIQKLATDPFGFSILRTTPQDAKLFNFSNEAAKPRMLSKWTGQSALADKTFNEEYPKMFEDRISAQERCLYLYDQEQKIYDAGDRHKMFFTERQKLIMKVVFDIVAKKPVTIEDMYYWCSGPDRKFKLSPKTVDDIYSLLQIWNFL